MKWQQCNTCEQWMIPGREDPHRKDCLLWRVSIIAGFEEAETDRLWRIMQETVRLAPPKGMIDE